MDLDFGELRQLVAALNQTDIAELTLKNPQFELTLRKATAPSQQWWWPLTQQRYQQLRPLSPR